MPALKDRDTIKQLYDDSGKIDRENIEYFEQHIDVLREEHPGNIVAIVDGELAASMEFSDDLDDLREFINSLSDDYASDAVDSAYITRVPDPDQMLLL